MPTKPSKAIKNIGPKSLEWLHEIGVYSLADVEALGAVEVYKRLKSSRPHQVTIVMLYGAMLNLHWNMLPPDMKEELRRQVQDF